MKALAIAVYLMIGAYVAYTHAYVSFDGAQDIISAITAVVAWPLVLANYNFHLGALSSL